MIHRRAAILSIGDELTLGQALDTNSQWLSQRLLERGVLPAEHATVPDDAAAITDALLRLARGRSADSGCQLIIVTGGLGPTADDLTRQGLADALGERLVEDAPALREIEAWFAGRGRAMPELNRVQALRPHTASMLSNPHGTAPGLHATLRVPECDVFCLPGPPREMRPMFEDRVAPRLRPPPDRVVRTRAIPTFGLGESEVAQRLGELMDRVQNPLVGTTASGGVVTCRLRFEGSAGSAAEADRALDATEARIRELLGAYVLGVGPVSLAGSTIDLLRARGQRIAVVESCTGGQLGRLITDVAGASDVFLGGYITYSNEQKTAMVGVPAGTFAPGGPGAVSSACAMAMAEGGLSRTGADHALAITGIAGPGGGSAEKPVGTVWVALASRDGDTEARRFLLAGERTNVREWSAMLALGMLRLRLTGASGAGLLRQQERVSRGRP